MIYLAALSSRRFLPNFTPSKAAGCLSLRFLSRIILNGTTASYY